MGKEDTARTRSMEFSEAYWHFAVTVQVLTCLRSCSISTALGSSKSVASSGNHAADQSLSIHVHSLCRGYMGLPHRTTYNHVQRTLGLKLYGRSSTCRCVVLRSHQTAGAPPPSQRITYASLQTCCTSSSSTLRELPSAVSQPGRGPGICLRSEVRLASASSQSMSKSSYPSAFVPFPFMSLACIVVPITSWTTVARCQ